MKSRESRIWVADASPIILLAKISKLDLLTGSCDQLRVPRPVADEILRGREGDPAKQWIAGIGAGSVGDAVIVDSDIAAWDLGAGESQALTLARTMPGAAALLDDRQARSCGAMLRIRVIGTLGVLAIAKREGRVVRLAPLISELRAAGCRLDPAVEAAALALAGEG